jgi:hypothetical protein
MAKQENHEIPQELPRHAPAKLTKFQAPAELSPHFGALVAREDFIQGIVPTQYVRELLDAFGLSDRHEIVFPFQHLKRAQGEIWSMRIEPAQGHTIEGCPVIGHQWIYHQAYPERVGAAA